MTRKAILTLLCLLFLLVGCGADANAQPTNNSSSQNMGNANIVMVNSSTTTTIASVETPTVTDSQPTAAPTTPPAVQPTNTPTSTPTTTGYHSCAIGAGNCPNPWGYVLGCGCGTGWQPVRNTPAGFCSWFQCITKFDYGNGTIGECGDGLMTHSAGISGACSGHGALIGELYEHNATTPTATPQAHSTPTPIATP